MIEIIVTSEDSPPVSHRFDEPRISIGRDADNDVVLDSAACSRHHAEIVCDGGSYRIVDLGSTNGILVDNEKVSELELSHGVAVTIGQYGLIFSLPEDESSVRTVALDLRQHLPEVNGRPARKPQETPPQPEVIYLLYEERRKQRSLKIAPGVEYVIGRSPSADLVMEDRRSSAQHARISTRGDGYIIRDLDSSNGTLVNDERIDEARLAVGDGIRIGGTLIRVADHIGDLIDEEQLLHRTRVGIPDIQEIASEISSRQEEGASAGRRRRLVVFACVAAALAMAAVVSIVVSRRSGESGQVSEAAPAGDAEILVQVAPVVAKDLIFDVTGTGSVKAHRAVTISAEVPARIIQLPVKEGAAVRRGDLVARLNDRDIVHQLAEAEASIRKEQVDLAREDFLRKERLFNEGAIVRSVLDQAKNNYLSLDSAYRSVQAKISQLNEQLAKTRIRAPFSGVVARKFVNQGEFVGPGSPVVTIENLDEMMVQVELSDRDFVKIRKGQPVEAESDAFPGRTFSGTVSRLGSTANPVTRTFEVEALLRNPDLSLRTGMIASLRIIQGKEGGLVVPSDAVLEEDGDRGTAFVVRDGVAHRVNVVLGRRLDRETQVLEGLSEGDEVIVYGHQRIRDGQPIRSYRK